MTGAEASFNLWWGLLGLSPLLLYIILVFWDVDPLPATAICVVVGAIITGQTLLSFIAGTRGGQVAKHLRRGHGTTGRARKRPCPNE